MISAWLLIVISISYISLLFVIAWAGDRHPGLYRHRLARTHIYALSLAVYFTSWTFYGAVGRATQEGFAFLPIYLGPLLVIVFFAPLLRRIIYMRKSNNSIDRKSTRLNSSHVRISYAVFCLKKKINTKHIQIPTH